MRPELIKNVHIQVCAVTHYARRSFIEGLFSEYVIGFVKKVGGEGFNRGISVFDPERGHVGASCFGTFRRRGRRRRRGRSSAALLASHAVECQYTLSSKALLTYGFSKEMYLLIFVWVARFDRDGRLSVLTVPPAAL